MAAIIAAILGGTALAGLGGFLGNHSQKKAAGDALNYQNMQTGWGQSRLQNLLYGEGAQHVSEGLGRWVDSATGQDITNSLSYDPSGAPMYRDPATGQPTKHPTAVYQPGRSSSYGPSGILSRMQGIGQQFGQGSNQILGQYDQATQNLLQQLAGNTRNLDQLGAGAEGMASQWGQGREAVIRGDAARSLKDSNRMADAALVSGGFNSPTYRANQFSENATRNQSELQRNLQSLSEAQIDRQLRARSDRTQMAGSRAGLGEQLAAGRSAERTGLGLQALQQQTALNAAPLQTELQAGMSSIMNPWLGQNASSYFPGGSALGSALQTGGNTLGALGGYYLGRQGQGGGGQASQVSVQQAPPWEVPWGERY